MLNLFAIAVLACLECQDPRDASTSIDAPARSVNDITSKLRQELARLEVDHASDFFAALAKPHRPGNTIGVSGERAKLVRRLDELVRDVMKAWVLRALEKGPSPNLLDQFDRTTARIVGHAEAIALEAILTPRQAEHWEKVARRPRIPALAGRYSLPMSQHGGERTPETRGDFDKAIRTESGYLTWSRRVPASVLFSLMHNDEATQGVKPQQMDLLRQIDQLACDVQSCWLLACLDKEPIPEELLEEPPTIAMMDRLSDRGKRVRASIVAHSEMIWLEAVLTSDQCEQWKRRLWAKRGVFALVDPEVASMLHLSKTQRDQIASRLEARAVVRSDAISGVARGQLKVPDAFRPGPFTPDEQRAIFQKLKESAGQVLDVYDQCIWEVLSTAQAHDLAQLIGKPAPIRPNAGTKKSKRSG